jgi:hypothetical protein
VGAIVNSDSSTTDIKLHSASIAGFRQGGIKIIRPGKSTDNLVSVSAGAEVPILSIRAGDSFNSRANLGELLALNAFGSSESVKTTTIRVRKDPTLTGANWQYLDEGVSFVERDIVSTAVSGGEVVLSRPLAGVSSVNINLSDLIGSVTAGAVLTITAEISSGSAADVEASISWKENT